jgi:2-oxoglutarate dehydrogenase E1 component
MAISELGEFTDRPFQEVLDDSSFTDNAKASNAQRVLLCSGQVYYDLVKERDASKRSDVAIIRVEQLYPWPSGMLAKILGRYGKAEVVWVQEEPRNMGAWTHVFNLWMGGTGNFSQAVGNRAIRYIGRGIAASPATGYPQIHDIEQKALLQEAFKS